MKTDNGPAILALVVVAFLVWLSETGRLTNIFAALAATGITTTNLDGAAAGTTPSYSGTLPPVNSASPATGGVVPNGSSAPLQGPIQQGGSNSTAPWNPTSPGNSIEPDSTYYNPEGEYGDIYNEVYA